MSQEVFEIVQKMNPRAVETQFVLQCAPMIAGLKTSNLLIIKTEYVNYILKLLKNSNISFAFLVRTKEKTTLLLYREHLLMEYLSDPKVIRLLSSMGYENINFISLLKSVQKQYEEYIHNKAGFPHELGLLLGYPSEDVKGYMDNFGKNALYTGYWQVYENPEDKICLFEKFEAAKEKLIRLLSGGIDLKEVIGVSRYN